MKVHYITKQLIYVSVENDENHRPIVYNNGECIQIKAHVYVNALYYKNYNHLLPDLCGVKLKDNVLVRIPIDTPSIVF